MESHNDVLIDRFDRYGMDIFVPEGFQKRFRVGEVGFIARNVWTDGMRGQQDDRMPESLKLPGPVMGTAACFEQNGGWLMFSEETLEPDSGKAMVLTYMAGSPGDGDLENGFCKVDGDCGSIHRGLLL